MIWPDVKPLPMKEAIEFWKDKIILPNSQYKELSDDAKVKAFSVSGIASEQALAQIFEATEHAVADGITYDEFKGEIGDIIKEKGWTGKNEWRVDNIFRTNIQTAYSVGRYKQMIQPAVMAGRPYWAYDAVGDDRTRATHLAMDVENTKMVYPANHPVWRTWYPPNGFRCRCDVNSVSEAEVKSRGLTIGAEDPTGKLIEPIDPKTGNKMPARLLIPDRGFDYNPGEVHWGRPIAQGEIDRISKQGQRWEPLIDKGPADFSRPERLEYTKTAVQPDYSLNQYDGEKLKKKFRRIIGGETVVVKSPSGHRVILDDTLIDHLRADGRQAYLPYLKQTIEQPFETWLMPLKSVDTGRVVFRTKAIGCFADDQNRNLLVVSEYQGGVWTGYTAFYSRGESYIQHQRQGWLLYGK